MDMDICLHYIKSDSIHLLKTLADFVCMCIVKKGDTNPVMDFSIRGKHQGWIQSLEREDAHC